MANIGNFKKIGDEFQGEIVTLQMQAKNVRFALEEDRYNDEAPQPSGVRRQDRNWRRLERDLQSRPRISLGQAGRSAPIYANLFEAEGEEGYNLVWPRGCRPNGE